MCLRCYPMFLCSSLGTQVAICVVCRASIRFHSESRGNQWQWKRGGTLECVLINLTSLSLFRAFVDVFQFSWTIYHPSRRRTLHPWVGSLTHFGMLDKCETFSGKGVLDEVWPSLERFPIPCAAHLSLRRRFP